MVNFFKGRGSRGGHHNSVNTPNMREADRLGLIHTIQSRLLEPYNSQVVNEHLTIVHAHERRRARILDVGTGTGTLYLVESHVSPRLTLTGAWAIDVANTHKYAEVVAVDIDWSNFAQSNALHGNVEFQTVDVRKPLPWPAQTFDIIHIKGMLLEVPHYSVLLERLAVVLRTGGIMIIVEQETNYVSAAGHQLSQPLQMWAACVKEAYAARSIDVSLPASLHLHLAASGVFQNPAFTQQAGVPTAGYVKGTSRQLASIGRMHSNVICANFRALLPVVNAHGYSTESIGAVVDACLAELCNPESKHLQRVFAVYGRKAP